MKVIKTSDAKDLENCEAKLNIGNFTGSHTGPNEGYAATARWMLEHKAFYSLPVFEPFQAKMKQTDKKLKDDKQEKADPNAKSVNQEVDKRLPQP